jgi:enoyl-CoA hydratase/carnithine racemase
VESPSQRAVAIERQDGIGWITLNRPQAINAINDAVRRDMPAALQALDDDPDIRVIVLQGAGERGFCAGADLREERPVESPSDTRGPQARSAWIQSFDRVAKPLIAAIHGYCLGGGLEIALACDLRIASPDAVFALPETGLGLIPGGGGTQRLPRIIGLGRALDLLLTGDRIDANEAYRCGLVTRVASAPEALRAETGQLAKRIAARAPLATRFVKKAARAGLELELHAGLRLETDLFTLLLSTEDRLEAAAAFREKRAPVFKGR